MGIDPDNVVDGIGLFVLVDTSFMPGVFLLLIYFSFNSFIFTSPISISLNDLLFSFLIPGFLLAVLAVLIADLYPYFLKHKAFFVPTLSHILYFCVKALLILITAFLLLGVNVFIFKLVYMYSFLLSYSTLFCGIESLLMTIMFYMIVKSRDLKIIYNHTVPFLDYQNIGFVENSLLFGLTLLLIINTRFYSLYLPYQLMKYNVLLNYFVEAFFILLFLFVVYMPFFLDIYDIYSKKQREKKKGYSSIVYLYQVIIGLLTSPLLALFIIVLCIRFAGALTPLGVFFTVLFSSLYLVLPYLFFRIKGRYKSSWIFHHMKSMLYFLLLIFFPLAAIDFVFLSSLPPFQIVFLCYKNIYDVLNIRFTVISLLMLRLIIVFLLISTCLLFVFFFYKRNLIVHFHYFLLDKNILFGLVPAALLILTLVLSVPLLSYIQLYNTYGRVIYLPSSSSIIVYYDIGQLAEFTNKAFNEYEFCGQNAHFITSTQFINNSYVYPFSRLPPPSLYGAFIPIGLFVAIISSFIMFLGNMYRVNKHFDSYLREYIGRYVDKSITQLRPIHRIFIAGYGMLGKKLTYTILRHQLINPHMLGFDEKTRYYDIILVPFTETGDMLKYEVAINNLYVITLESEDLAINIDHPVLGKVGLMDVVYSAGERVYVPIILNDVSLNSILRYVKLVEPPPQNSFGYPIYIFILVPIDKARSKAMYSLLNKTINNYLTQQVLLVIRASKSSEIIRLDTRILDGKLCFLYPDYLMGYIIGREILS